MNLSKTEIRLLERGLTNKAISFHIGVSENTVKFHLKKIYKKLGVHNRTEAVYKLNKKQSYE